MILVKPSAEILAASGHSHLPYNYDDPLPLIEAAGRLCYKSEDKTWTVCPECGGDDDYRGPETASGWVCPTCNGGRFKTSAEKFVAMLRNRGHLAMLEHSWAIIEQPYPPDSEWDTGFWKPFCFVGRDWAVGNLRALGEAFGERGIRYPDQPTLAVDSDTISKWPYIAAMTAKIICDHGVSHEIVRHRPASYAQESTRYCNYQGGVTFVTPSWVSAEVGEYLIEWDGLYGAFPLGEREFESFNNADNWWFWHCAVAERDYLNLLKHGWQPQQARSVLPNSTKTEIIVTASLAEWQHIFRLRCAPAAHPQMRQVMIPLRELARELYQEVFGEEVHHEH
jgi:thymidylate synthase (FAD)